VAAQARATAAAHQGMPKDRPTAVNDNESLRANELDDLVSGF
jgi:hypothetical protein